MATADRARSSKSESGVSRSRRLVSRMPGTVEAYGGSMPIDSALAASTTRAIRQEDRTRMSRGSLRPGFRRAPFRGLPTGTGGSSGARNSVSPAREYVTISSALLPPPLEGFGQLPKKSSVALVVVPISDRLADAEADQQSQP